MTAKFLPSSPGDRAGVTQQRRNLSALGLPSALTGTRSIRASILLVPAAAALLAGCMTGEMRAAQTALPAGYEVGATPTPAPVELERWWTVFNDSQLNTLVEQALAASPDARSALAVLQEAQATRDANYYGAVFPDGTVSVNGQTGGSISNGQTQPDSVSASFSPSWELDLFGRVRAGVRGLNANLNADRFQYEATRTSLIANVASGLFQARGLANQLAEARENLRISRSSADIARQRVERGLAAGADAQSLYANVSSAEAQVIGLEAQLEGAKRNLLVLVGRGADPRASLPVDTTLPVPPAAPSAAPGDLLTRRPDVRQAEQRVTVAASQLTVAKLAFLPTLRLTPSVSLVATSGATGSVWSIGLGLAQPLLDWPRLRAQDRAAVARGEGALIAYEAVVQRAYAEAETNLLTMLADQRAIIALTAAETAARSAYDSRQIGYDRGLSDLTTLLQAEQVWRQARLSLISRRAEALQTAVNTYKALGGGWNPQAPAQSATMTTPQGTAQ